MKPGRVSSAERDPPPIVCLASSTRTERPARASTIAAARPLGPAPTTTASGTRLVGAEQSLHAAGGRPDRVERRTDRRGVPYVAPLRPLALLVDAHDVRLDLAIGLAEVRCDARERVVPEAVLLLVAAHRQAQLEDRIRRAHQDLRLGDRLALVLARAERDPAREHVALRGHQRERL